MVDPLDLCKKFLTLPQVKAWLLKQVNELVITHLSLYAARVAELEKGVEELKKSRIELQHKVDEEEDRYARGIPPDLKKWIEQVDEIICEFEQFNGDKNHELAMFHDGYLPKPGIRYHLSKEAYDLIRKVNGLLQTEKHSVLSYWLGPPSIAAFLTNIGYESFSSRDETVKKINAALKNPSIRLIGVYGWSGVGKTTLVKEVAKEALQSSEGKMFQVVIMANVTKNPDIRKMQGQIADMLGMALDEESDIARAARIRNRLKNEKQSTLIILDDLWEKVDFNMLGIPFDNDNILQEGKLDSNKLGVPFENDNIAKEKKLNLKDRKNSMKGGKSHGEHSLMVTEIHHRASSGRKTAKTLSHYIGCKVLLISESKQILSSQMEGKEDHIFCVDVLEKKEAETFFKKMAGVDSGNSGVDKLAAQIADKCHKLPMSIVTTAKALKGQSRSVWEDVLRKLEWQKSIGVPESSTKLSYDLLEDEELKFTFLLCARMVHDALIADLVKYCIGLGFLQGIYTVRQARDRVYALVGKLKDSGLLSDSYSNDRFTMQNIIRSAALSIASEENDVFSMTKRKIDEWPDKLERYTAISLHHCDIVARFPRRINWPRLRFFHVHHNGHHLSIPKNFFKGMKELKVLILTGIRLSPLPSSIKCLTKLRMLCLEHCELDEDLSIIGELKSLRILSFSGSDIKKLPVELKQLKNLQIFDISNCSKLEEIPPNVISSFSSLEELYMRDSMIQTNQALHTILSELWRLNQLTTLDIQIPNTSHLPNNLFFDKLYSYKIVIGDLNADLEMHFKMPEKHETSRFLAIQSQHNFDIHSQMGIKMLFERVETLLLEDLEGVEDVFYCLNLKGFPCLKHLLIVSNSNIQSLINPKDRRHPEKAFPKLESLYLYDLKKMKELCSCELSKPSFAKLKVIKITLCGQLKHVFSVSVVQLLTVLQTIEVSECNSLRDVVQSNSDKVSECNSLRDVMQSNADEVSEYYSSREVVLSNADQVEHFDFPELRSLTLQSLSNFDGFYPISSTEREKRTLFNDKVVVSKLERLELSSIQIDEIWSDKLFEQGSHFQKLTHLDVNGCPNLKYLISFSMANSLVNLQSLFVSDCPRMECIFSKWEGSHPNKKGRIFQKLKNIKLSNMKSLKSLVTTEGDFGLLSDSFSKLDTLIIEECHKFSNVFPSFMVGKFRSLCNLRVTNCRSMKAIFDLNGENRDVDLVKLQDVHVETLPELEHVWKLKKDHKGILKLDKLQKIWVHDCYILENIFPFAVAKCLNDLECLMVSDCIALREIIAKGEATNTGTTNPNLPFGKLKTVKFLKLPKLVDFCPGALCNFPVLNDLSINHCDKLEPFNKGKLVLFPEMVINKLKSMQIESWHVKSSNSYMGQGNHRRDNLEELCLSRFMDIEILYSFLHRNPNLESLSLNNCFFDSIVPPKSCTDIANLGVVPTLKSLKLIDMPNLENLEFEPNIILQRIELMILKNCPCLVTIVPSSVSLMHLTNLEVVNCNGLESLMLPSTAESLGQLSTMKVISCESLKEIVRNEEENADKVDIVFEQLKTLELVSLKNLNSFCCSKSCVFQFPTLEKLVVSACYKMKIFSEEVSRTPILQKIYTVHEKDEKRSCWEGSLNATIQKMFREKKFFEGVEEMSFSEHLELQKAWQDGVGMQNCWFYSLKTLKLEDCEIQPCAIPSNILPYLKSLRELEVRGCKKVKVIFQMNDTEFVGTTSQLKKLTLKGLSELTRIWETNGQGIFSFQNLEVVFVCDCENLQSLFPVALARNLKKLNELKVEDCKGLLEIVGKAKDTTTDTAAGLTEAFLFPRLSLLDLYDLPQLTHFYTGSFILECPTLNELSVMNCLELKLFENAQPEDEGSSTTSINRQSLFPDVNAISNIEALLIDWKHISVLRSRVGQLMENLEYLNYIMLDYDENEKSILPVEILGKAPNLQEMLIGFCKSLELFRTQNPKIGQKGLLGHLKTLTLFNVSELESIGSEDSPWLKTICEKLKQLYVEFCPDLTTLMHSTSTVSFSCLKELNVSECGKLKYLFTSSAAEMLKQLEEIKIDNCKLMKNILEEEQGKTASEKIKFERLHHIKLNTLSKLECFYSGNDHDTLDLPALIQVDIWECPKMEIFSKGSIIAKYFRGIQASSNSNDDLVFHNDLNSSVKKLFLQKGFLQAMDEECLSDDHLELKQARHGNVGLQNKWLRELVTLKLSYCILPYAIPSCILPYLKNLKELEVRNSNAVKVIFEMNDTQIMETAVQLEKLHLEGLSELTHVWEKNSQGVLIFQNLQHVIVKSCDNLETLFPAALAKNLKKLKELKIESCDKLLDIVEKEEDAAANVTENFVFPCLKMLDLNDLPHFTYFYPQTFTLECPSLNNLKVLGCPKLELFQSAHPEGKGEGSGTSINRQPHISYLKAMSNLEELSLDWKHISALSSSIRSGQFTEGFRYLNDISLYFDDADENEEPILPTEVLQKAPNLKEMRIEDWKVPKVFLAQNLKIGDDGMLGELEVFTLANVSELQSINSEDSSCLNASFEKLHKLNVFECPDLTTLIESTSTVSFSCLRELHITKCPELQYLFTSSAAKNLMKIEVITVEECKSMKEIVAKEDETNPEEIRFEQLRNIYLITLSSLECFYSGNDTLQLSSLIQVKILQCPKMEIFSQGLIHAESLRGIQSSSNTNDELVFYEDLNTSVKNTFLQQDPLVVRDSPMLKEIWLGSETVPDWCFRNLISLVVESCEFLSNAILPSHLLPLLHNLRELRVLKCNSVKSIFGHSKMGSQGSQSLPFLKKLHVEDCEELVEIVAKAEEAAEEENQGLIIFPSLISLKLSNLPNLRSIYFGMRILEWPMLKKLKVSQCQKLNFFTTEFQNSPDSHLQGQDSFRTEQQDIVSLEKVTPHLKKLSLGKKEALMIEQGKLCVDLPALNFLRLRDFHDESDEFPFAFCSNATFTRCFEQLVVSDSAFKEIFPSQTFNIEYAKIFSQLEQLHIVNLSQLESIGLEHSWVHPFLQKLEGVLVRHCDCLTNLTPSTVSFSNLKELSVYNCHGLKYFFTSSTAKTLGVLRRMEVSNCDSIEAIVDGEDEDEDEIIFKRLWVLTLESLPELTSFYSGSSTLNLLHLLLKVSLSQCNNMEVFSHGDVVPKNLEMTIDGVSCKGDINSTIKQNFAVKRQPEKSLSGVRSLLDSTH